MYKQGGDTMEQIFFGPNYTFVAYEDFGKHTITIAGLAVAMIQYDLSASPK